MRRALDEFTPYTNASMSPKELEGYDCVYPYAKGEWPWGPPHYQRDFAGYKPLIVNPSPDASPNPNPDANP